MKFSLSYSIGKLALALSLFVLSQGQMAHADDGPKVVKKLATQNAAIISKFHKRAKRALVTSAQDKTFRDYFTSSAPDKNLIDTLSLSVQRSFNVEEMCLINNQGHELSRIVGNKVESKDQLSTEEASAIFFKPSFATPVREVFLSPIYLSPDVNKWVIAYVTPIEVDDEKVAILHYEHSLEALFQTIVQIANDDDARMMIVNEDNLVIFDTANPVSLVGDADHQQAHQHFAPVPAEIAEKIEHSYHEPVDLVLNGKTYVMSTHDEERWHVIAIANK